MAETHPMVPGFVKPQPPKPRIPDPKPIHNELWSIRALAVETLGELGIGTSTTIDTAKARLLLTTLIALIDGPQKAEYQERATQGLLTAMSGRVQKAQAETEGDE